MSSHSLHFTSERELLTCKVEMCLPQLQISLIVFSTHTDELKTSKHKIEGRETNFVHLDMLSLLCLTQSLSAQDRFYNPLLLFLPKMVSHRSLTCWSDCSDFGFLTRTTPANPLKQIFDIEGGGEML